MRGRFSIIFSIVLVLALLVVLNAASYVRVEHPPDSEVKPDRSTFNAGATGTRALYDFLQESGHQVIRWREPPAGLLRKDVAQPTTWVIIGLVRVPFKDGEAQSLLEWVKQGGHLIIIDRIPDSSLLPSTGNWRISTELAAYPSVNTHPDNAEEMMADVLPLKPIQPSLFTRHVEQVAPSRFAGRFTITGEAPVPRQADQAKEKSTPDQPSSDADKKVAKRDTDEEEITEDDENGTQDSVEPSPSPRAMSPVEPPEDEGSSAPISHLADERGAVLVDYAHGKGRIVILSDPFIVANGGINRADNLQLALNIITETEGLIAFDEYHQGYGATSNRTLNYLAGTPMIAIFAQAALIVLAVLWTQGRRFARPLPAPHTDRRSKLEFVASMAELQQRARAYDLALENIYGRTRRALARYSGVESTAPRSIIATRVAARSGMDHEELESLMRECEDAIAGEAVSAQKSLTLAARLRELERSLSIRMRSREIRQAEERKAKEQ